MTRAHCASAFEATSARIAAHGLCPPATAVPFGFQNHLIDVEKIVSEFSGPRSQPKHNKKQNKVIEVIRNKSKWRLAF